MTARCISDNHDMWLPEDQYVLEMAKNNTKLSISEVMTMHSSAWTGRTLPILGSNMLSEDMESLDCNQKSRSWLVNSKYIFKYYNDYFHFIWRQRDTQRVFICYITPYHRPTTARAEPNQWPLGWALKWHCLQELFSKHSSCYLSSMIRCLVVAGPNLPKYN